MKSQSSSPLVNGSTAQAWIADPLLGPPDADSSEPLAIPRWFAVRTQPQHEKTVTRGLSNLGLETFLPLYRSRRVWSDRLKELDLPLFPGYVFAHLALYRRLVVLRSPGVLSMVSFGNKPAPVSDEEIAALKTMVSSGLPIQPWPFLKTGQRVHIERGPLRGLEALLLQFKGSWRAVVSVELLQRSVAAEVDRLWISPIKTAPSRF